MKHEKWKTIINVIISVLTAIATTLGMSSCPQPPRCAHALPPLGGGVGWGCRGWVGLLLPLRGGWVGLFPFYIKNISKNAWIIGWKIVTLHAFSEFRHFKIVE